ncbi:adenylate/guanylate cyclase domain-containing protein [Tamlana flava]|uniref:adenylate/guanylate cyclase domain-containing protein n=1 Tax=Tamlana flava TaxID=3158572 RepID=UPI00351B610D
MLTPKAKHHLSKILPFGIIWLVFAFVFLFIEHAAAPNQVATGAIKVDYRVLLFASSLIFVLGLVVGSIERFYLNALFAKRSFLEKILGKTFIYASFLALIVFITFPIAASLELKTSVWDEAVWQKFFTFLKSLTFWSTALQLAISLLASLFYAEISDNMGHGVLLNFLTGKYHKPKEETRIFMFLDMKASTSMAERLGHIKYFGLLNAYYRDLSEPIIEHSGEIYQYVGDEIVVSWHFKKGIKNNNCIRCFEGMKASLKKLEAWYQNKFGEVPIFKAGFHMGKVTTGEIGSIKKDIIFTGDVLNTTARIQALCNSYGVEVLISELLVNALNLGTGYSLKSLGKQELRGKTKSLVLYTFG